MKSTFGKLKDGREVTLYTIENDHIIMKVMNYGATLVSFIQKDTGVDIVEGFDDIGGYLDQTTYIGASIGRTANRIEKGKFTLNGKEYTVPINNGGNCNHGGIEGFDKKIWSAVEEGDKVTFRYTSIDGEEGYPGNLFVKVVYRLLDDGISISTEARSDQDTLFAYTNHSYFNLEESEDAMNHEVMVHSNTYGLSDENGLTLNELVSVEGTPFDFQTFKQIGKDINVENEQLKYGSGYDHHYVIDGEGLREMAVVRNDKLELHAYSDYPGMHLYSANWLENKTGKKGHKYPPRSAICLEAEYMPNAINYPNIEPKPIVHVEDTQKHEIQFRLKVR
jgi:aldose 1-epimerase